LKEDKSQRSISSVGGDNLLKCFVILVEMINFCYAKPYLGVVIANEKGKDPYRNTERQNPCPFPSWSGCHKTGSSKPDVFFHAFNNIKKSWSKPYS
jgi:hypothetical protein